MFKKLPLIVIEKLTQLIYTRRDVYLRKWLDDNGIKNFEIHKVLKNDRCVIFNIRNSVYCFIAGSDDGRDWWENALAIPVVLQVWTLFWGYVGYAKPAEKIVELIREFCERNNIPVDLASFIIAGHSRGDAIAQNVFAQINTKKRKRRNKKKDAWNKRKFGFGKDRTDGWGFGGPDGGGIIFRKKCNSPRYRKFKVDGDPVPNANPFLGGIGEIYELPRYVTGSFGERIEKRKHGEMNHHGYHQVAEIEPFKYW